MVIICVTVLGFFLITFVVHKFNQIYLKVIDLTNEVKVLTEIIRKQHGKGQKEKEGKET